MKKSKLIRNLWDFVNKYELELKIHVRENVYFGESNLTLYYCTLDAYLKDGNMIQPIVENDNSINDALEKLARSIQNKIITINKREIEVPTLS